MSCYSPVKVARDERVAPSPHALDAPMAELRARLLMLQSAALEAEAGARAQLRMAEARLTFAQRAGTQS